VVVHKAKTAAELILGLEKFDEEEHGNDFPRFVVKSFSRTSDFWGIAYAEDWERERFRSGFVVLLLCCFSVVLLFLG